MTLPILPVITANPDGTITEGDLQLPAGKNLLDGSGKKLATEEYVNQNGDGIALLDGQILIGSAANLATGKTPSGAMVMTREGVFSLNYDPAFSPVTPVVIDHADSSPKTVLASVSTVARYVRFRAVATEAPAGEPDLDIGVTGALTSIVEDFKAGVWKLGDVIDRFFLLEAGQAITATIAAAGTSGALSVQMDVVVQPKVNQVTVAGQNESTPAIPVTGIAVGDRLVSVVVFASGVPTSRPLTDFTVGAGVITVVANPADNSSNKYLVTWEDRTA